jgi:hypothetical protein
MICYSVILSVTASYFTSTVAWLPLLGQCSEHINIMFQVTRIPRHIQNIILCKLCLLPLSILNEVFFVLWNYLPLISSSFLLTRLLFLTASLITIEVNLMPGGITGLRCSWGKWIQEHDPPGWASLKNRINKICSWVLRDSELRKAALAIPSKEKKNWKLQTRLLVREGAPHH